MILKKISPDVAPRWIGSQAADSEKLKTDTLDRPISTQICWLGTITRVGVDFKRYKYCATETLEVELVEGNWVLQ